MKKKINKKADTRTVIIPLLLGGFVLVVAYLLLFTGAGKETLIKLGIVIPGFGEDPDSKITEPERFRYDIQDNIVKYYDGTEWHEFNEITLNKKTFTSTQILKDFTDEYYYKRSLPHELPLSKRENNELKHAGVQDFPRNYKEKFWITEFDKNKKGEATLLVQYAPAPLDHYFFVRPPNNKIYIEEDFIDIWTDQLSTRLIEFKYIDEPEKEMIMKANIWQDSILTQPITLRFATKDNSDNSAQACIEKYDNQYLVADLIRNKPTGDSCPHPT
ncbi:MAG: hypothetical protein ABIG28_00220 [archaeon]